MGLTPKQIANTMYEACGSGKFFMSALAKDIAGDMQGPMPPRETVLEAVRRSARLMDATRAEIRETSEKIKAEKPLLKATYRPHDHLIGCRKRLKDLEKRLLRLKKIRRFWEMLMNRLYNPHNASHMTDISASGSDI